MDLTSETCTASGGSVCTLRDPRIEEALAAVSRNHFVPVMGSWREWSRDAIARLLEDLSLRPRGQALVIDPVSGYVPALLARLVDQVHVVCPVPSRAVMIAEQLAHDGVTNVRLSSSLDEPANADTRYQAIVLGQPQPNGLPKEVALRLAQPGCAVLPIDHSSPPRRALRVLTADDGSHVEEEIDLSNYRPLLGDMLVAGGLVMRGEIIEAMHAARKHGRPLGQELLQRGSIREDDLYRVLAEQHQMPFADTGSVLARLDRQVLRSLPRKYLDHYKFIPVRMERGVTTVVTSNLDLPLWDLRGVFEGTDLVAELTTPTDLHRVWTAIELGFVTEQAKAAAPPVVKPREVPRSQLEDSRAAGLFDAMLLDALAERASDIHLENYDHGARLRFRIDGSLHDIGRYQLTAAELTAVVNVIKIAADLDIAERRLPQGGRVHRRVGNHVIDLRVQTQPTLYHENVVIRILPQEQRPPTIEELGFPSRTADRYRRLLKEPHGLVLVVGATGSGKSTTLYAGLQLLAKDSTRKVITIEDPIEFAIAGVQQTQVNAAVGFRFAEAMRSFVREDPDVILVGEIRDSETALEAIRAAQTGHLVLATLHCNDTVDAVQRLADLGMHPNSVASELSAVMAQRLARRICTGCKVEVAPDPEVAAELFPDGIPAGFHCFAGKGCSRCNDSGTRGRIAVVEMLMLDAELRRAISRRVVLDDLRTLAHRSGYTSLRDSAIGLVRNGDISMRELFDVLSAEQMRPPRQP